MKEPKHELFLCDCFSADHQMIITYVEDEGWEDVYANVHLNHYYSFWQRLIIGIKYIFGQKSRYGAFDEFIFHPGDSAKLQKVVDYLKEVEGRTNTNFIRFGINQTIYRYAVGNQSNEVAQARIELIKFKIINKNSIKSVENMINITSERQLDLAFGDLVFIVSKHKNNIQNPQSLVGQSAVIDGVVWKIKEIEEGIGKGNKKTDNIGIVVV